MSNELSAMEQAVSRALRDSLDRLQRNSDELHHAVADVVAACSSNKVTNALPPLLRAQTSAASLTASLEVLSRFIAITLQPGARSPFEAEISRLASSVAVEPPPTAPESTRPSAGPAQPSAPLIHAEAPAPAQEEAPKRDTGLSQEFDVNRLTPEEQELHRRANRVAKVSMQDIKMLRPEQVRLGRENKDICIRLKDDIEKAHREYDRRFKPIMDHPVDYFYRWMVEILAEGDAAALGEYPYAVPVRQ
ncbi:MAG TPA: hypothetical protein VLC94_03260 [Candidatus Acidoferrum sp.]|nr:hypothetical protein [Candidatus Acidoferrum sp.]